MAEYLLKPLKQKNRPISSTGHPVLKVVENIEKPWKIGRIYPPGNIPLRLDYSFSAAKPQRGTMTFQVKRRTGPTMGRFKEDFVFTLQAVIGDSLLSLFHLKSFPGRASRRYRVPYCISSIGAFGFRDASRPDLPGVFSFCFSISPSASAHSPSAPARTGGW